MLLGYWWKVLIQIWFIVSNYYWSLFLPKGFFSFLSFLCRVPLAYFCDHFSGFQIFPGDVYLDGIINAVKSSRYDVLRNLFKTVHLLEYLDNRNFLRTINYSISFFPFTKASKNWDGLSCKLLGILCLNLCVYIK